MSTNTNTNASANAADDAAKAAKRREAAQRAAVTRKANRAAVTAPVVSTGQTHAGIDIAGLRLIEDGPGYWIAYKGMSTDRRMGTVAQVSPDRFIATGRGMSAGSVDSVQAGAEFIAESYRSGRSDRARTPQAAVASDLRDSARARNRYKTFKSMAHKTAHVTLPARIAKAAEAADKARARYGDQNGRAALAGSEIAARRVADLEAQCGRVLETIEWIESALELEVGNLRALCDKALGLGLTRRDIQAIVASVKPKGDARDAELAELAELLA